MNIILNKLIKQENLTFEEAGNLMDALADGSLEPEMMAAILTALSIKGETSDEIAGLAYVMRRRSLLVKAGLNREVLDIVGTGGDKKSMFNVSTLASIVAVGAGVLVAKHGNSAVTSKCGSTDVMKELGVNIELDISIAEKALQTIGFTYLFAPKYHPALKYVMPVRKKLAIRTVFNILGPLCNPARAEHLLLGVYKQELVDIMAEALLKMKISRAMIVHGSDGADEITLSGLTSIALLKNQKISKFEFDPRDYGFKLVSENELKGGTPDINKRIALDVLNGKKGTFRDIVVLNSAMGLHLNKELEISKAIQMAQESIDSGRALKVLEKFKEISHA